MSERTERPELFTGPQQRMGAAIQAFLHMEAAGGIVLMIAAVLAVIVANSPWSGLYHHVFNDVYFRIGFDSGADGFLTEIRKSLLHWVNDGLMVIFFFLVGLEIKREVADGELSGRARALLPALAALGGMAVPALVYWLVNKDAPGNMPGWAISSATDIAFALGILGLLGSRVPVSLKILLTAIAVLDDLGAILIIALFYTQGVSLYPLIFAAAAILGLFLLNRRGHVSAIPYMLLGFILWVAILKSGVHATVAGVITAMFIPMRGRDATGDDYSPLGHCIHNLHPWVAFGILPLFAFANAGVPFTGMGLHSFADPLTLGIILGLFIGKQLGIFATIFAAVKAGLCPMPEEANWMHIYGIAILCGIGFTMSLFIGGLAFDGVHQQAEIRLGVLAGSVLSAVAGYGVLRVCGGKKTY